LYFVSLVEVLKNGDFIILKPKEHKRFIKCLQRDSDMLFGITIVVVVVENDA
jgi:hypothetical protein